MKFRLFQESRVGARNYNQDRIGHWSTGASALFVVADGMGGHRHGEVAAEVAVEFIGAEFVREARPRVADPDIFLFRNIGRAHLAILEAARTRNLSEIPRTVIVACIVQEGYAWWSHIGDSRLYHLRHGRVAARTRDHTRVQQLIDAGRMREEATEFHPERNQLLQCLGGDRSPKLSPAQTAQLARDDVVLLCTDGFWGPLTQRQILLALTTQPFDEALKNLMTLAETRAGDRSDNLSVLAFSWGEDEVPAAGAPYTVPAHNLPTEVQDFTATDLDFLKMTDADVEKAIADIRAALNRNKPRS